MGALILNEEDRSVSVDMTLLGTPQKTYDADLACLEHRETNIRLFFGKIRLPTRNTLATRVEIRYPIEYFHRHMWQNSRDFHARLRERAENLRIPQTPNQSHLHEMEADKDHSEWANFEVMGYSGTEAAIDFFHLPPTDLARYERTGVANIAFTPILRVQLGVDQLLALLEGCSGAMTEIEKYLPHDFA